MINHQLPTKSDEADGDAFFKMKSICKCPWCKYLDQTIRAGGSKPEKSVRMTAYLQERQYTTASLQEMAIYETAFLHEGLYTTASLQEEAIYETASLQEGAVCEPRGAHNLDAVVGERRDLLHARHHHVLHLHAVGFEWLVSNGRSRMVDFEWMLANGWF